MRPRTTSRRPHWSVSRRWVAGAAAAGSQVESRPRMSPREPVSRPSSIPSSSCSTAAAQRSLPSPPIALSRSSEGVRIPLSRPAT
jgi:hypothetical protein